MSVPQGKTIKLKDLFPTEEHKISNNVLFSGQNGDVLVVSLGAGADTNPRHHEKGHLALGIDGKIRIARGDQGKGTEERPAITQDNVDLAVAEGADVRRVETADDLADDEAKTVTEKDLGHLEPGMALVTGAGQDMGVSAEHASVFVTVPLPDEVQLHDGLHLNKRAKLADLIDYRDAEVAREVVLDGAGVKLMLLAFDYEQQLAAHTAGANALFMVLEGDVTVEYEGTAHTVHAGEQMLFAPDAEHAVSCEQRCKVALLRVE